MMEKGLGMEQEFFLCSLHTCAEHIEALQKAEVARNASEVQEILTRGEL